MESPARRLSRTPELPTLHQLHALSSNDRAATRLYLGRAIAQSQYYITLKLKGERFGEYYGNFRSQVFKKTFDYAMPKPKEHDPKLCKICGSAWSSYTEVFEPRGPPKLVLLHGGNNV